MLLRPAVQTGACPGAFEPSQHPGSAARVTPALVAVGRGSLTPIRSVLHDVRGLVVLSRLYMRSTPMAAGRKTPKQLQLDGLPTIHPNAAGMDIGAELIVVAVPPDRDPEPVRVFRTFTPDLQELVSWLLACGIDTIAMESTGIYWVAIYELIEAA